MCEKLSNEITSTPRGPTHIIILMTSGGGVILLGLKFWAKVVFWFYERRWDFLGREKKTGGFFWVAKKDSGTFWVC